MKSHYSQLATSYARYVHLMCIWKIVTKKKKTMAMHEFVWTSEIVWLYRCDADVSTHFIQSSIQCKRIEIRKYQFILLVQPMEWTPSQTNAPPPSLSLSLSRTHFCCYCLLPVYLWIAFVRIEPKFETYESNWILHSTRAEKCLCKSIHRCYPKRS